MAATATLHYLYDPLCGWCYGAKPLLEAAAHVLPVKAHGGGMMAGRNSQPVTPQLRDYVMPHDRRIAEYTGQPFGQAYFEGLLRDPTAVFDSAPPTSAVLAAEQLAGRGLDMLGRVQSAHYVEGRKIADFAVLSALAVELGLDAQAFAAAYADVSGALTDAHIKASRDLLARVGGQGFPTLVLERAGQFDVIDAGQWLGKPEAFARWLHDTTETPVNSHGRGPESCGIDGC